MRKPLLAIAASLLYCMVFSQYTWVNKRLFPDSNFYQAGAFVLNGMGYIVGGQQDNNAFSNKTWQYDPSSDGWVQKADYPHKISGGASFVINGIGYLVGGFDTTQLYESDNNAYDPATNTWTAKTPYPEQGVGGGYYFVINGIAYVGAGVRNSNQHGVGGGYAYSPLTNAWTPIANFPNPAIGLCTFAIDSFGYAGLGGDGSGHFFNSMYRYSPTANTWSSIAPYPGKARYANHISFVLHGKGYVGGGITISSGGCAYTLGDLYSYDPITNTWSPEPGLMGPPRHGVNSLTFGDSVFVVGGYNPDGIVYYRYVNEFKPAASACNTTDTTHVLIRDTTSITVADTLIISIKTGVAPNVATAIISVYPNPAHSQLIISTDNYQSLTAYTLKVTNTLGQTLFSHADDQQQFIINIAGWAPGVYYLQIIENGSNVIQTKEIVIQ